MSSRGPAGLADGRPQTLLWVAAIALCYAGPYLTGVAGFTVHPGHFVERHGLIVLIALGESVVATIHLNPADHEAITGRRDASLGQAVQLVADPSVEPGGCLVRSAFGVIDAGIETQVREVARALLGDDAAEEAGSHGDPSGE